MGQLCPFEQKFVTASDNESSLLYIRVFAIELLNNRDLVTRTRLLFHEDFADNAEPEIMSGQISEILIFENN